MGNWWLAASSGDNELPHASLSCAEFFGNTSSHPGDSGPPTLLPTQQPRFGVLWLLDFPKTKITFEREDFRPSMRFRKIQWGSWWWLGELCEVPRCLLWRKQRHHCLHSMFLVSCIFFNKCLCLSYCMADYLLDRTRAPWLDHNCLRWLSKTFMFWLSGSCSPLTILLLFFLIGCKEKPKIYWEPIAQDMAWST